MTDYQATTLTLLISQNNSIYIEVNKYCGAFLRFNQFSRVKTVNPDSIPRTVRGGTFSIWSI